MRMRHFAIASAFSFAALTLAASSALAQSEAMSLCKGDVARLCPGVQMGGGRIIKCLKAHQDEMTVGCAKALQKMKGQMGK